MSDESKNVTPRGRRRRRISSELVGVVAVCATAVATLSGPIPSWRQPASPPAAPVVVIVVSDGGEVIPPASCRAWTRPAP